MVENTYNKVLLTGNITALYIVKGGNGDARSV